MTGLVTCAAAALSIIHLTGLPFASLTIEAGTVPGSGVVSRIICAISAFPAPHATKQALLAAFTTGREKVIRSGGGFGESEIGRIHLAS